MVREMKLNIPKEIKLWKESQKEKVMKTRQKLPRKRVKKLVMLRRKEMRKLKQKEVKMQLKVREKEKKEMKENQKKISLRTKRTLKILKKQLTLLLKVKAEKRIKKNLQGNLKMWKPKLTKMSPNLKKRVNSQRNNKRLQKVKMI